MNLKKDLDEIMEEIINNANEARDYVKSGLVNVDYNNTDKLLELLYDAQGYVLAVEAIKMVKKALVERLIEKGYDV